MPLDWQARSTFNGEVGEVCTGPLAGPPLTDFSEFLRTHEYDPEKVELVGKVNQWRKQQSDGTWRTSYFFGIRAKASTLDLPALYAAAKARPARPFVSKTDTNRVSVAVLADMQAGKTGSRGGTPELLDRLVEKREKLTSHWRKSKPCRTVIAEAGDLFEGFNSGGNPMFTNDLSLSQQMDFSGTELYEFVKLAHRFGQVDVMGVPSNHTAWKNGKQQLGKPGDDLGLFVHKQVAKIATAAKLKAFWHLPAEYDEGVTLDVLGTVLGVIHGNQWSQGGAPLWWGKQQHGGQPIGAADILVSGHYHHLNVLPSGRNPYSQRSKWWLQAPTLDNGSDWYRSISGDDSDPGLLVFDITEQGFDLQSLTVL